MLGKPSHLAQSAAKENLFIRLRVLLSLSELNWVWAKRIDVAVECSWAPNSAGVCMFVCASADLGREEETEDTNDVIIHRWA